MKSEFLDLVPAETALQRLLDALPERVPSSQKIATMDALGRFTTADVFSHEASPAFNRSTVDGFAVCAADTFGANDSLPAFLKVIGEVPMGAEPSFSIRRGQAAAIHTGGMLPAGADAVVMIEHTQAAHEGEIEVLRAVGSAENVLEKGEDVQPGQVVIPKGTKLIPAGIGGLLALGITAVEVARKPVIAVLSSGDEVVPPDQPVRPGQVRDINSYTLSALIVQAGGIARRYGILPDQMDPLERTLRQALNECDAIVITAGSSASSRDLTAGAIQNMGLPGVLVHGVNIKPGKPTILAVCDGKAVIGLPGNPVSALVIAGIFVTPVICRLLGIHYSVTSYPLRAKLTTNIPSQTGRTDFIPVKLIDSDQGLLAEPIFFKSNLILMLARADGLARIPMDVNGLAAGEQVEVQLL
jgi:molybdopterin molybdotransferase